MTNEEFVSDLMNFSPVGALTQLLVLEGIRSYAEALATASVESLGGDKALFHPNALISWGKDVIARFEARDKAFRR